MKSLATGRGMPPMKVSGADRINLELGLNALPNGFVSVPISTFADLNLKDDVSYDGCAFASDTTAIRAYSDTNYSDWKWIANFAKDPLADSLGVDYQVMSVAPFIDVYHYQDAYVAMEFEGLPFLQDGVFDDNTYLEMRTL